MDDGQGRPECSRNMGADIREFRRSVGLTQRQFAAKLEIAEVYVREVEHGRRQPGRGLVLRILDLMKEAGELERAGRLRQVTIPVGDFRDLEARLVNLARMNDARITHMGDSLLEVERKQNVLWAWAREKGLHE
jgi:transcriptional regulator with XRE-family HTH domain